ncbi:MAG: DUF1294 domain-containing protein [Sphingomonas sp.]|uniref:DUF1294 domain-containing protein n=1 Tax=Sphingomonas sp. TaxID=28214 RepID=UPI0025E601AD|nr:DUF1294 domain-containing protein [Sphingomonas sp.]MBX3563128.1 DUF1294 domain-containing protein [Sphingomonas sp.]
MLTATLCALLLVNLWTILRFREDKRRAVAGARRIPEADLLALALIGGTPGAFFARHRFRHKTRKQPFSTWLWLIAAIQAGALIGFGWPR